MLKNKENIKITAEGNVATAYLCGEIDHHNAAQLRRELDDYICLNRPMVLRLDASGIDFMDSSGLGLLMGRYALLKRLNGELILSNPTASVWRMVKLAGMERILNIETSEKDKE